MTILLTNFDQKNRKIDLQEPNMKFFSKQLSLITLVIVVPAPINDNSIQSTEMLNLFLTNLTKKNKKIDLKYRKNGTKMLTETSNLHKI